MLTQQHETDCSSPSPLRYPLPCVLLPTNSTILNLIYQSFVALMASLTKVDNDLVLFTPSSATICPLLTALPCISK